MTVSVVGQNRITRIVLAGEVAVETDSFSGKITLSGEAKYTYGDRTITEPGQEQADTGEGDPVANTEANAKEEGQTSSYTKQPEKAASKPKIVEVKG